MMSKTTTLYQHGTLALLVPGLLDGTLTMHDLLTHGDTGIGTGEGLDGELIILAGVPYQIDHLGHVNRVSAQFTLPFANSHFADFHDLLTVTEASRADLQTQIGAQSQSANTFYAECQHVLRRRDHRDLYRHANPGRQAVDAALPVASQDRERPKRLHPRYGHGHPVELLRAPDLRWRRRGRLPQPFSVGGPRLRRTRLGLRHGQWSG